MKMKSIFALLIAMFAFSACGDKETTSGEMIYNKGYEQTAYSAVVASGSKCEGLLGAVQTGIAERIKTYNKEWTVKFSGSSEDSALAKADQEAVADFDAAVASLKEWQETFDDYKISKDFGSGSFSLTYVVRVWRDKTLKESEPIVFEYSSQN